METQKTRILVTGKYLNPTTYILQRPDQTIYKTIREGETFQIGRLVFYPVRMTKTQGKGTTLVCRRLDKKNRVISEFYLENNKTGLWALTEAAAKKGVFHWYNKPKTHIEKSLSSMFTGIHIVHHVKKIHMQLTIGGTNPNRIYSFVSDNGQVAGNTQRDPYSVTITGGTYLIYYHYDINHRYPAVPVLIFITDSADESQVAKILKQL